MLSEHPEFVNATRPGGSSLYAPLHQAAHGGAWIDVVRRLLDLGAWRTLQNARGERPVDVTTRMSRTHLGLVLEPEYKRHLPLGILLKMQSHFHAVIGERAARLVEPHPLRGQPVSLVLQWHLCCEECSQGPTSLIVVIRRAALRPAAPVGPGQDVVGGWRHRQDQAPQQPAHLLDAQREARPRPTLNAARLRPV
jgi:hypothetical protein